MDDMSLYRCRRIYLKPGDDSDVKASSACEALITIEGVLLASVHDARCIHIVYSLEILSFEVITTLLVELDIDIDDSLLMSVRNSIYHFLDDNARDRIVSPDGSIAAAEGEAITADQDERYWQDYR